MILVDNKIPFLEERLAAVLPPDAYEFLEPSEITPAKVKDADALIVRTRTRCDASLLEGSRVRLVATATIGKNHIDTEWCEGHGILAVNAAGCNAPAVMQYVAASLASLGFNPQGKTIGVIGKGNIGSLVVRLFREAGAEVIVSDPPRKEAGMTDEDYLPLETVLERSDAVTLHVPLTYAPASHPTYRLIDNKAVSRLKRGAALVNASRGSVIASETLYSPRSDIRWVVDTWPFEETPSLGVPPDMNRYDIATPHIAGYSLEGKQRATRAVIDALNRSFALGIPSDGLADYDFLERLPSLEEVAASYDPLTDAPEFRAHPADIDRLRDTYPLRPEARVSRDN